jgi:nicotinamide-nucleotide amidase
MTPMLDALIAARLAPAVPGRGLFRRVLKITGLSESEVDTIAAPIYSPWLKSEVPISTTILAGMGQIELHLSAAADAPDIGHRVLAAATRELAEALGSAVYSSEGQALEAVVGDMLRQRRLTIAVAESCSGGLLASRLTDVPGSSDYFDRGVVCYSNEAKIEWLDVAPALIEAHGAVSEPVARAMAEGIRVRAHVPVGVGITGIAGPGGGTAEKPVGTVAVAVSVLQETRVRTFRFPGGRDMVKFQSSQAGMDMLRLLLQDTIPPAVD